MSEAPRADRIEQHLVDEAHDRRVFDVVARDRAAEVVVAAADLERLEVHALLVTEVRHRLVSACSIALSRMLLQLVVLDDDRVDRRPVWNLISSMACRLVGSATPRNRRLPRLNSGSTRCLASSLSETVLHRIEVDGQRVQVEQRHAVFGGRSDGDVARLAVPEAISWVTKLVFSLAA
jgi:hypothetical protein